MRIALNFVPLKSGGGVQVGLDFLSNLADSGTQHDWFLFASKGTPFESASLPSNCELVTAVSSTWVRRLHFERHVGPRLLREFDIDLSYTQFGPHWPRAKVPHVVGCAYSNLFYPEIDFWDGHPFTRRMKLKFFDHIRMNRLRLADHVIFETPDLASRAIEIKGFDENRVSCVLPAVSTNISPSAEHSATRRRVEQLPSGFRLCLISGPARHKNIESLVHAAAILKDDFPDTRFVLTLPPDHRETLRIQTLAETLGVASQILNLGPVPYEGCAEVYRACDAAILPSTLESFSNNIAEAWAMERPLLITDMDWARSVCGNAAVYIQHDNPSDIAAKVAALHGMDRQSLVEEGKRQLMSYPDSKQRFEEYLAIIEKVESLH